MSYALMTVSGDESALQSAQSQKQRSLPVVYRFAALAAACGLMAACQPTVRVEAPKEPITINLNVKLDAEVRLKLEEQAREEVEANPDIF